MVTLQGLTTRPIDNCTDFFASGDKEEDQENIRKQAETVRQAILKSHVTIQLDQGSPISHEVQGGEQRNSDIATEGQKDKEKHWFDQKSANSQGLGQLIPSNVPAQRINFSE